MTDLEDEVRRFVLENAVKYEGKPNVKSVMSALLGARADLRSRAKEVREVVERLVTEVERMSVDAQRAQLMRIAPGLLESKKETAAEEKELPDLPGVDKWPRVVMRLAPFPSGPLHIGNSRMVILNDYYVKRYDGELILVFDDTIGSTDKQIEPAAYDLIPEGLDYLGVRYHRTVYKSDRLDLFYRYAVDLLQRGYAYVCDCDSEVWRTQHKTKKIACACRSSGPEENLARWEKMLDGTYPEKGAAVRLKTGMDDPDPAMRDHVILRISETPHPRVGSKYRVWPLLEYSWGIDDHELGVSHIIRGKDLVKEGKMEQRIWQIYGWQQPELVYYGRLKFQDAKLSKSKSRKEVLEGTYAGWDDPRTWSLQSLVKRGIAADALRKAMLDLGLSMVDISLSMNAVYSENRKLRDAEAPRLFFVSDPVWLDIADVPAELEHAEAPVHPDFPERGVRRIPVTRHEGRAVVGIQRVDYTRAENGGLLRLKDFINVTLHKGKKPRASFNNLSVEAALKVKAPIIQWVPKEDTVPVELTMIDGQVLQGLAEPDARRLSAGVFVQFERYGFARIFEVGDVIRAAFAHK
ncbi:MAG: glutamate--tRNA ligase [Candidatus Thorarchaeota archaeon]|nr:glutamate--tRNA ligase [Candidatus Thorarchaeota archaeon]